nr:hypothetical protein [uncultured Ralstonia sp.]
MTATTPASEPEWLVLGAGQMSLHWLPAGTTLVVLEGRLRLEPPSRWVMAMHYTLGAGHAHVLDASGWWRLHADTRSGAHLRIVAPVSGAPRLAWPANWIQPRQTSRG